MLRTVILGVVMCILAAPSFAGEAEVANAKAFVDSLTEVKDAALGKEELRFTMLGIELGRVTIEVAKGEYDGKACYVLNLSGAFLLGGVKHEMKGMERIAPNLALLSREYSESEDGKVVKAKTYRREGLVYKVNSVDSKAEDEADRDANYQVKASPTLMLGSGNFIAAKLLPAKAMKYEFEDWQSASNTTYPLLVETAKAVGGVFQVVETATRAEKDKDGKLSTKIEKSTTQVTDGKILRVDIEGKYVLTPELPPKRTPITSEAIDKQDKEVHAVCMFLLAGACHDQKKLRQAVNIDRLVDLMFEHEANLKGMPEEKKAAAKEDMRKNLFKPKPGSENETEKDKQQAAAVVQQLWLQEENFVFTKGDGELGVVTFSEDFQRFMSSDMKFTVEKSKDGKWQIVYFGAIKSADEKDKRKD